MTKKNYLRKSGGLHHVMHAYDISVAIAENRCFRPCMLSFSKSDIGDAGRIGSSTDTTEVTAICWGAIGFV
jgi:hypothetical protein